MSYITSEMVGFSPPPPPMEPVLPAIAAVLRSWDFESRTAWILGRLRSQKPSPRVPKAQRGASGRRSSAAVARLTPQEREAIRLLKEAGLWTE